MSKLIKSNTHKSNWLKCVHWLNEYEIFPLLTRQKICSNNLSEEDFTTLIRDGLCLIKLLDTLSPLPSSSPLPQYSSSNNIGKFLMRCRASPFLMTEHELFTLESLSNQMSISPVVRSLSFLSHLKFVREKSGRDGFYFDDEEEEESNFENDIDCPSHNHDDDSYVYNEIKRRSMQCDYQDMAPWLLGLSSRDLTAFQLNDSSLSYITTDDESSSSSSHLFNENLKSKNIDKYLYTIREIVSTEEKFLALMRALMEDFLQPLATVMTHEEKRATNINIQALYKLHTDLYAELHAACLSEANRTIKLCNVFSSYQKRFENV